jgi:hypothetical protein
MFFANSSALSTLVLVFPYAIPALLTRMSRYFSFDSISLRIFL